MFRRKSAPKVKIALSELDRIIRSGPTDADYRTLDSAWSQAGSSAWDQVDPKEVFDVQWATVTGKVAATVVGQKAADMTDDSATRFDSEEEALAFIDATRMARARSRREAETIRKVMGAAIRAARRFGVSKEEIIRRSGLARQTVYNIIDE